LSGEDIPRGRSPRERDPNSMIEQSSPSAALDEARLRQQAIGARLRQMFDEVVNEPVPDEFLNILRKADKRPAEND
jgi:anti-sigma factor RsiW